MLILNGHWTGKASVLLINQLEDMNHYQVDTDLDAAYPSDRFKACGVAAIDVPKLIDTERNIRYLKDDSLYFKVSVELSSFKHWLQSEH